MKFFNKTVVNSFWLQLQNTNLWDSILSLSEGPSHTEQAMCFRTTAVPRWSFSSFFFEAIMAPDDKTSHLST